MGGAGQPETMWDTSGSRRGDDDVRAVAWNQSDPMRKNVSEMALRLR